MQEFILGGRGNPIGFQRFFKSSHVTARASPMRLTRARNENLLKMHSSFSIRTSLFNLAPEGLSRKKVDQKPPLWVFQPDEQPILHIEKGRQSIRSKDCSSFMSIHSRIPMDSGKYDQGYFRTQASCFFCVDLVSFGNFSYNFRSLAVGKPVFSLMGGHLPSILYRS